MNVTTNVNTTLKKWKQTLWLLPVVILLAGTLPQSSYAATPSVDNEKVRVGLFLDVGNTYSSIVPVVNVKSAGSLSVGQSNNGVVDSWLSIGNQASFGIDGYRVKVLETADFATAAAGIKLLQSTSDKSIVFSASKNGGTVYQLYTGMYSSKAAATTGASRVASTVRSILNGQTPVVKGGFHLSAGSYATEAQANAGLAAVSAAGLDGFVAITKSGGALAYNVWVGEEADAASLASIKSVAATALPDITLTTVNSTQAALIKRTNVTSSITSPSPIDHYMVSGTDVKMMLQGNDSGTQVTERSARTYRGDFEISNYNGQLAWINVLPMEEYLYSVVGGEVSASWPAEALKAQAVAARSYARFQEQGSKFKIADVVDTTLSQAYNGVSAEDKRIIAAVDATAGEIVTKNNKVIEAIFSANSGGASADPSEVWNGGGDVFVSVVSKEDAASQAALKNWYHVLLDNGKSGYVREDNVKLSGKKTSAGLDYMTVTAKNTNVRPLPVVQSNVSMVGQMNPGDQAVVLELLPESNSYQWIRGPFTSAQILATLKGKTTASLPSTITSIQVSQRGPSGRVTEIKVNGAVVKVKYPDVFRSALNSLPSTLFDVVNTANYVVVGSNNDQNEMPAAGTVILGASGQGTGSSSTVILNGDGVARVTEAGGFLFTGNGNGHGLGMSQWGAKGMADKGSNYKQILQHYYNNVQITKG
ncbi:SpoIID/LytB domain-containing protein [Paenibacillus sp. KACC 21273]|uniref:SpoIID/LytB domain-containing protein n=1 Tax=Paenibacillus sp. KACC 21273 TaxID=3025665 RepID=UPI002366B219|nr:SpoIID/LytB domain-containing protein [Paenibacillus sp. KACC 21273]WDF51968.1 SpoIID/LytB domain-containing protein [Paenibacillus sp. KACC 21273]